MERWGRPYVRTPATCSCLVVPKVVSLLRLPLLLLVLLATSPAAAGTVTAVIVFGDSSVDPGNNNFIPTLARSNFLPYGRDFFGNQPTGRFCNGRLATDFISEELGLPPAVPAYLDPEYSIQDFATGVSFASAATGLDNATADVLGVIPMWKQLDHFREYQYRLRQNLSDEDAESTISGALYLISIGTNDFMENYFTVPGRSSSYTIPQYQDFLISIATRFIEDLYSLGARNIDFTGLCPVGCLPLVRAGVDFLRHDGATACNEEYNAVARQFNVKLQALVKQLNEKHQDLKLVYTNVYDPFQFVFQQPESYGFEDWTTGCCGTGLFEMSYACDMWNPFTCNDASKYVFWDAIHPSEAMNRLLAYSALNTSLAIFK